MVQFFQTMLGRTFYEAHVPQLIKAIRQLTEELKRYNDFREEEKRKEDSNDEHQS